MKKILISIMIIAVVAAIAIGGTVAFFTDSAAVGGNDDHVPGPSMSASAGTGPHRLSSMTAWSRATAGTQDCDDHEQR